jgi:hypothetical protein
MFWIFASVVAVLAVYNRKFRKIVLWGTPLWLLVVYFTAGA